MKRYLTSCSDDKFSGLELETKDNLYRAYDPGYIFSKVYGGDVKYAGTNHKEAFVHNMKFWGLYK